jgi:hypothetical protein
MIHFLAVFLFFTSFIFGQQNNSLSYPVSVPWNTPFELSLISSLQFPSAEILEIIVESEQDIDVSSIHFNTLFGSRKIDVIDDGSAFRGEIHLKELQLSENFQVLIAVKPNDNNKAGLEIIGRYISGEKVLGLLAGPEGLKAGVEFYKPAKYAGKALSISGNESSFNLTVNQEENFAVDFWLKIKDDDLSVLKIFNNEELLFDIFINSYGMLSLQTHFLNIDLKPYFISRNVWNHIAIFFNNKEDMSILYCNGIPVSINTTDPLSFGRELEYSFAGAEQKEYIIDQLKFSRGSDLDIQRIISGKNFTIPSEYVDTKKIFHFDTPDLNETAGIKVRSSNTKFVRSDAPLGLKTPDLNITMYSTYFDLEWKGGDVSHSVEYILEKSENNSPYQPLGTFAAENDPDKNIVLLIKGTAQQILFTTELNRCLKTDQYSIHRE